MESFKVVFLLGLIAQPGLCQINPAMLAMMGGGGAGGTRGGFNPLAMGMAGGAEMNDFMAMQALSSMGSGGFGGSTSGGGGMDPMTMMMLNGGGAAISNDMMQQMMMMNLMRQSGQNQNQNQNQNQIQNQGQGGSGFVTQISGLLVGPAGIDRGNAVIPPGQQNALWGYVQLGNSMQRIMDAVSSPTDRIALERDGLASTANFNRMLTIQVMGSCPRQTQCTYIFCEQPEMPFTPESFYLCRGCPRCPMDPNQRNLMNMMSNMGGAGGPNMAQAMMMMNGMGQGGAAGGAGAMNPAAMMAFMNMQQQQQQQQQPQYQPQPQPQPTQTTLTIPPSGQRTPPKPAASPATPAEAPGSSPSTPKKAKTTSPKPGSPKPMPGPRPPPEFIAAMRAMSAQMRPNNPGNRRQ